MCPVNGRVRRVRNVSRFSDRSQNYGHVVDLVRSSPREPKERASSTTSSLGRPWSQPAHLRKKSAGQRVIKLNIKSHWARPRLGSDAWCVGRIVLDRRFRCGREHAERGSQHVKLKIGVSRYAEWPAEWKRNPQRSRRSYPFGLFTNEAD